MAGRIGIIIGTSQINCKAFSRIRYRKVPTRYGSAEVWLDESLAVIRRHGRKSPILPHMINHRANIAALKKLGAAKAVGLTSAGSLKQSIAPGQLAVPHDFINLADSTTFFDRVQFRIKGFSQNPHTYSGFDEGMRKELLDAARTAGIKLIPRGVYVQVRGPRIETKAEVAMLSGFADYVSMTLATEAVLAMEAGIAYAGVCSIDNYARGVAGSTRILEEISRWKREMGEKASGLIDCLAAGAGGLR